jgi:hypothetical protein
MDLELADYIFKHFYRLLTDLEKQAYQHYVHESKLNNTKEWISRTNTEKADEIYQTDRTEYLERGLLTEDPKVLTLVAEGWQSIILYVAKRIIDETPEEVYLNHCARCGKLARTPYAKQCRCGHNWREVVAAEFMMKKTLELSQRPNIFFFTGWIVKGEIRQGMQIDLTFYGINKKALISTVETVYYGSHEGEVAIGTKDLKEEEKQYLQKRVPLAIPIIIEKEKQHQIIE